jgi:tRNA threonylcarbamoyladenosine modification (KEOPS) complex  Pcc1 subunit
MKNGVTIKIYGRAGNNIIINIPGNDVKELIAAVNK